MRSSKPRARLWPALFLVALAASTAAPAAAQERGRPVRGRAPATRVGPEATDPVAVSRVVIRFASGAFSLLDRKETRKVLPASDALPEGEAPPSGFWYELRAGDGSVRYRRIIEDPVRLVFEGPEDPSTPLPAAPRRSEGIPAERVFSLLIPAAQPGDLLVLFSSPLRLGAQGEPATEVAKLDLFPIIVR